MKSVRPLKLSIPSLRWTGGTWMVGFVVVLEGGGGWRENRKSAGWLPGYPGCSGQVLQSSIPYRKINSLICHVKMLRAHLISHHYLSNHLPH